MLGKVMGIMGFFREKVLDTLQESKKNEKPTTGQVITNSSLVTNNIRLL